MLPNARVTLKARHSCMDRLPEKQNIVGIGISKTSYPEVVELCRQWSQERRTVPLPHARYVCVASVHGIIVSRDDPEVAKILNEADIVTPDGMPLVWAIRSFGWKEQQRVYGPTLMLEICRQASQTGERIFLYGGREDTLVQLTDRLAARFPGLQIAGAYSPPFRPLTPEEDENVQQLIRTVDPDLIFVGISTPKQEKWMYAHRSSLPGVTMIGVGAAFDFHAGHTRQAPSWMQRSGFEWLFRLAVEPARLWRRYLLITPRFLPLWAMQKIRSQRKARA
jgi:N-acetylglucosaminyldiphosphoundecaprenol N-acetyl-beta-D-mannosaminyltransferase